LCDPAIQIRKLVDLCTSLLPFSTSGR
jgi:hypothetical protein